MAFINKYSALWAAISVLIIGNIAQSFTYLNHDVAWVLHSSGRLLDGGIFGEDIVAANPPLIWWISAIPQAVSRLLGIDAIYLFRIMVFAISAVVLLDFHKSLLKYFPPIQTAIILVIFSMLISVGADRNFGQREHLAVLFLLPYILRAANVAENGENRTHWSASIFAGIGVAFKPHFILIPLLVELFIVLHGRTFKHLLRRDVLISVATIIVYLGAVFIWAQPYVSVVVPMISEVYWGFSSSPMFVAIKIGAEILLLCLAFILIGIGRFPPLSSLFFLTSVGFLVAALLQAKGYSYHIYPIKLFLLMSLVCLTSLNFKVLAFVASGLACSILYLEVGLLSKSFKDTTQFGTTGQRIQSVTDLVVEKVPVTGQFLAISTHPFPGFPVANYANRDWAAKSNSRLFLPVIVRLRTAGETADNLSVLKTAEKRERSAILLDLQEWPALVLIDVAHRRHAIKTIDFDFLSFYLEDPEFRAIWGNYEELENELRDFRSFVLKGS